ncbi:hypothetical protein Tco_0067324 [Tanacetum coccineum]
MVGSREGERIIDTTRAQQKALDDDLVAPANRLQIGKCNLRLSPTLKSKEPTIHVVLDALKLTSFYKAFEITADVPEIYMQEFWVTALRHHSSLRFKMNGKSHTINVDNFRDMFKIFPKLLGQQFEDPPLEEEILSFIRDLGHTDLVFQVENKNFKKNNDMYYPRFTKVIIDYFMPCSKAYKTYHAYATGEKILKTKYVKNKADPESSPKKKSAHASKGKIIKTLIKIKLATKRSLIQTHNSHATGSGGEEGTCVILGVPDVPTYNSDDEQISWKSSDEDDDDEAYDDETQGVNVKGEELDEEQTNEEEKANELYRDVNVNLEGRDTKTTDAPQTNIQSTQVTKDTHVIITAATPEGQQQSSSVSLGFISNMLNPNPDTGIDSILNLNTESTSLVDVLVSTNVEMPPSSVTPLPPPPIPFIQPQQQTLVPTPTIVPSTSLQNLPTIGSLFKFKDRVKALEDDFSEFK